MAKKVTEPKKETVKKEVSMTKPKATTKKSVTKPILEARKILMATSEFAPFIKSGGLGDMVSALSIELAKEGCDVKVVMPRYYDISKEGLTQLEGPLGVPLGFGEEWCAVYHTTFKGVQIYFVDHEELFGRKGIYGSTGDSSFNDNGKRYAFLSRAVFQLCRKIEWIPEVIHAHDWATALCPIYLYTWEKYREFAQTASVFTIHNLGYQGWFGSDDLIYSQLSHADAQNLGLEEGLMLNYMRGALHCADLITTVSPTYSHEIRHPAFGFGLDGLLNQRQMDLFGVLNGVDYSEWNPETDKNIAPHNFSASNLSGKAQMKAELQKTAGLEVNPDIPLIGMVSRFAEQKGFGALAGPSYGSLASICLNMKVQFVIVGTGEAWCEAELQHMAHHIPNLKVFIQFNNKLAHQVEAASDFFLMPSAYEPCGLNQLYSLKYGTLPIVHRTGGLADSVEQYSTGQGTGFLFDDLTPVAIYGTVQWAIDLYHNHRKEYLATQQRAMAKDFSWKESVERYIELYQWAVDRKQGRAIRSWAD